MAKAKAKAECIDKAKAKAKAECSDCISIKFRFINPALDFSLGLGPSLRLSPSLSLTINKCKQNPQEP
jgi:hypothetical protein